MLVQARCFSLNATKAWPISCKLKKADVSPTPCGYAYIHTIKRNFVCMSVLTPLELLEVEASYLAQLITIL